MIVAEVLEASIRWQSLRLKVGELLAKDRCLDVQDREVAEEHVQRRPNHLVLLEELELHRADALRRVGGDGSARGVDQAGDPLDELCLEVGLHVLQDRWAVGEVARVYLFARFVLVVVAALVRRVGPEAVALVVVAQVAVGFLPACDGQTPQIRAGIRGEGSIRLHAARA